jgi:uncharacterized protein (DUF433 family)
MTNQIEAVIDWKPLVTADQAVLHGTACFGGTRVPVSVVLDNLAEGESAQTILDQYPTLRAQHITAAIAYAAEIVRECIVRPPA